MVTSTGAWSQLPVAAGSDGATFTVMVGGVELPLEELEEHVSVPDAELEDPELLDPGLDGQVATVPTEDTTPGVVWLLGRVMVTLSPAATSVCSEASSATCTWRVVEVAWRTWDP
jgi:hypothetical protein